MHPLRRRRMALIALIVLSVGVAAALLLTALNQNIQHFYSPTEVNEGTAPKDRVFKLGGVVLEGSVQRDAQSLKTIFVVTDRFKNTTLEYSGIMPDLFKEGQSVIGTGTMNADQVFVATELLAKHDETYMPKEVAEAIAKAKTRNEQVSQ